MITIFSLALIAIGITGLSNLNAQMSIIDTITSEEFFVIRDGVFVTTVVMTARDANSDTSVPDVFETAHFETANFGMSFAIEEPQDTFQFYSIIIAAVFILIGAVLAYVLSGQTLKPVKALASKIEEIDANNLDTPIEPPKSNDEISKLTHSFNNMLGKLNRSFESQKLFAQNAAHELKTPLASIMTNIEVLQLDDEPSVEEYADVVSVIKDSTVRLIELVEGLLSLNNTVDETKWQAFDALEVFKVILGDLCDEIERKELKIDLSGQCTVRGDKALLERAFQNLVHNAVRYNVANGTIRICLEENEISIEDSGIGIAKEKRNNIFEPFYCVDNSRSKKLGGHGLGMTIAKNIFDMHSIKICVLSELGKGTKIILQLP
jgi:signal transduction histidine kinase